MFGIFFVIFVSLVLVPECGGFSRPATIIGAPPLTTSLFARRRIDKCSLLKSAPHLQTCHRSFSRIVARGSRSTREVEVSGEKVDGVEVKVDEEEDDEPIKITPFLSHSPPINHEEQSDSSGTNPLPLTIENVERVLDEVRPMLHADG